MRLIRLKTIFFFFLNTYFYFSQMNTTNKKKQNKTNATWPVSNPSVLPRAPTFSASTPLPPIA